MHETSGQVDAAAALCDDSFPPPPLPCVMIHSQRRHSLVHLPALILFLQMCGATA
jgi:hypothetical protein